MRRQGHVQSCVVDLRVPRQVSWDAQEHAAVLLHAGFQGRIHEVRLEPVHEDHEPRLTFFSRN
eukprot:14501789-Alexandrium_andersonii.AAC.1